MGGGENQHVTDNLHVKHNHVVYGSPLWHKDTVQTTVKSLPSSREQRQLERDFVNDAIKTTVYNVPRKIPIIPRYDAMTDKSARAYFKSPNVQSVLAKTMTTPQKLPMLTPPKRIISINKLSERLRCLPTPSPEYYKKRRAEFINDAILTNSLRTKYKDIIPKYDAALDYHSQDYFQNLAIQRFIKQSCSV